jgi:hypothetical protein
MSAASQDERLRCRSLVQTLRHDMGMLRHRD